MTMIKIDGIRCAEDVEVIREAKPHFAGLVFIPCSEDCITIEKAVELADMIPEEIATVGVFRDQALEEIIAVAQTGAIDYIQLSGNESDRYVYMANYYTGLPVINSSSVKTQEELEKALNTMADYLMLDTSAGYDWSVLGDLGRPYFLTGGLDASNIGDAVSRFHPFAVDAGEGLRTDGRLDAAKLGSFMETVRSSEMS